MKIGVDISSLQGPHRMRGIGYVTLNFLKNLPDNLFTEHSLVLFAYNTTDYPASEILLELGLNEKNIEIRTLHDTPVSLNMPGKLKYLSKALRKLRELNDYRFGDSRIKKIRDLDAFIQLDQSQPLPRLRHGAKNYFIGYDLIPYALESHYLWSYSTARKKGLSRKASIKCLVRRFLYIKKLKINSKRAHRIFAISKTTANDYVKYVGVSGKKIKIVTLGVNPPVDHHETKDDGLVRRYYHTSWGYLPRPFSLKSKRFLLFVGGADHRRRLADLVAAYNHLRAEGHDFLLVLSGDTMQGPRNVPTHEIQKALTGSAYEEDIVYLGFTDDHTRDWLYRNAFAYVFPSIYEGFGLPVLEAMSYGTPVISYRNTATIEVAGDVPLYANDPLSIRDEATKLMNISSSDKDLLEQDSKTRASKYSWRNTSLRIISVIVQ